MFCKAFVTLRKQIPRRTRTNPRQASTAMNATSQFGSYAIRFPQQLYLFRPFFAPSSPPTLSRFGAIRPRVQYDFITSDQHLRDYCQAIAAAPVVAFDTEFVSEHSYQPELCLIQLAAEGRLAIVDPLEVQDLSPLWELLTAPERETLVHAGREEYRFLLRHAGRPPARWFDVQIAAGLIGMEYPASYGTLSARLLGKTISKDETRTDWRRRPLTERQLEYALLDVADLEAIRDVLHSRLNELGRTAWVASELAEW